MISVLTVNYQSAEDLFGLAQSIASDPAVGASDGGVELIVTNNSPGEAIDLPPAAQPWTTVLETANVGYGRGINLASGRAQGDVLFLANPDLRLRPGVLTAGAAWLRDHRGVGALLPRLIGPAGEAQCSVRRFYTWPAALYARCPLRGRIADPAFFRRYLMADDDLSQPTDVDWGLGGAMFLRRGDFPKGRIFDPRFHLYFEDVDLCMRLWKAGRRVVHHPGLVCDHVHRRESRRAISLQGWRHLVSTVRFLRKHGGFPPRPPAPAALSSGPLEVL